MALGKDALPTR